MTQNSEYFDSDERHHLYGKLNSCSCRDSAALHLRAGFQPQRDDCVSNIPNSCGDFHNDFCTFRAGRNHRRVRGERGEGLSADDADGRRLEMNKSECSSHSTGWSVTFSRDPERLRSTVDDKPARFLFICANLRHLWTKTYVEWRLRRLTVAIATSARAIVDGSGTPR